MGRRIRRGGWQIQYSLHFWWEEIQYLSNIMEGFSPPRLKRIRLCLRRLRRLRHGRRAKRRRAKRRVTLAESPKRVALLYVNRKPIHKRSEENPANLNKEQFGGHAKHNVVQGRILSKTKLRGSRDNSARSSIGKHYASLRYCQDALSCRPRSKTSALVLVVIIALFCPLDNLWGAVCSLFRIPLSQSQSHSLI